MRQFGLIGYPLSHSFSQKFFTDKFEKEGLKDCRYEAYSIPAIAELPALLKKHPSLEGLNVTIPYKEQVIRYLSEQSPVVQEVGACNCIRIKEGKLVGYNTDVIGFEQSLSKHLQPHHKKALILGTGGAGKAVEYVLKKRGIRYRYVSRKPSVNHFSYEQVTPAILAEYTLIINTTPLGMYPNVTQAPPFPYNALTAKHYLFDAIYNPAKTLFLQRGEQHGAAIQNGLDMLIIQAEESWKIWNS
ncbi:MAG TPA: shikimate dehydrogenase [Chitinophagaceae bacterium]|jgi:shikimate dehydrogenase